MAIVGFTKIPHQGTGNELLNRVKRGFSMADSGDSVKWSTALTMMGLMITLIVVAGGATYSFGVLSSTVSSSQHDAQIEAVVTKQALDELKASIAIGARRMDEQDKAISVLDKKLDRVGQTVDTMQDQARQDRQQQKR